MALQSAGVLAGAYRGGQLSKALSHCVSSTDIKVGRLSRKRKEALCNKKLDMADNYDDTDQVSCPKCLDVIASIRKQVG